MLKKTVGLWVLGLLIFNLSLAQVDTTFIYRSGMPYGTLDIRIAKSSSRYYYLQENKTFSFRESSPGVRTNTYRDMTGWDSSPFAQGNLREKNGTADYFIMNYRLLFPQSYNTSYSEGYPLIVMMHGLGERGNCWNNDCYWGDRYWKPNTNSPAAPTLTTSELLNNDHNLLHGGNTHLQMRNAAGSKLPNDPTLPDRSFPGFVLFPQNLNGWDATQASDVIRIVRLMIKKYNIDPNRVYIHGLSNGGAAVYDVVKRAPWLFSAAATMSAVSDGSIISQNLIPKVITIPVWTFQGGQDTNPSPSKTSGYVKKFKEGGMTVRYTLYSNLGHGTWNKAYSEPDFFKWLRDQNKSRIHVYADNPTLCSTTGSGVKLDYAEGFLAYQWEKNGVIISGATSASYTATTPGTYRARFSRISRTPSATQWNDWSQAVTVTTATPPVADIEQIGSVVLKDLNYYNYAHLKSKTVNDHYYWYKDGVLVNLSGTVDDTVRLPKFSSTNGNGAYTLVVAGFNKCKSEPSEPVNIFFTDSAPINITAPSTFTGSGTGQTTATVNWTDASSNEGGFEIWRRKKTGTTTYSKWVMATITGPNIRTFNDSKLDPGSTYQYKIRAVSGTGRSNYTPASSSQFLTITTAADPTPPTAPTNLVATATAVREVTLTWNASSDANGIREYRISYGSTTISTGTPVLTYRLTNLNLNSNYTFTVRAVDTGGNLSAASNSSTANTTVTGLYYKHATGAYNDIDAINWNFVEYTGKVNNFTLAPRTQEDYFDFQFEGFLYINTGGSYQFQTTSDDGSRLTLDNVIVADNDGLHGTKTVTGAVQTLTAGAKVINVKYFEDTGGQNLTVRYKGPDTGNAWLVIPDAALRSGSTTSAMTAEEAEIVAEPTAEDLSVSVYPNPSTSSDNLSMQVVAKEEAPIHVSIVDMMGKPFYEATMESSAVSNGMQLVPTERMLKGIYVITVKQGNKVTRERVIIKE
jgi:hypothetical protein